MKYPFLVLMAMLISACGEAQDSSRHKSIHQLQHEAHRDSTIQQEIATVRPGIETLFADYSDSLRGRSVGVIVNHTSKDKDGVHLVDRLVNSGIAVSAIFAPEHGFRGGAAAGQHVQDGIDTVSGARIYSLYGTTRKPLPEMLKRADLLLYDIQDVGARFYTYISTMGYAMQAAAEQDIPFWVLDRPDPITGDKVGGPVLEEDFRSFVGLYPIPVRYGMTPGELARMIAGEGWLDFPNGYQPKVIPLRGWKRGVWYDQTDLPWIAPSPNMPDLETATVYPGLCLIEGTNVSEGRGTPNPFLQIGAPWINGKRLSQELNKMRLPGVVFEPIQFTPEEIAGKAVNPKYEGEQCGGVRIRVIDREQFRAVATGVQILAKVQQLHPAEFQWREAAIDRLYGSDALRIAIAQGKSIDALISSWGEELQEFRKKRKRYLMY